MILVMLKYWKIDPLPSMFPHKDLGHFWFGILGHLVKKCPVRFLKDGLPIKVFCKM